MLGTASFSSVLYGRPIVNADPGICPVCGVGDVHGAIPFLSRRILKLTSAMMKLEGLI